MIEQYKEYLKEQNYSPSTIANYATEANVFLKLCRKRSVCPEGIDYKTTLKYVKWLQRNQNTKKSVSHRVTITKNYFGYLIYKGYRAENPIENLNIKGIKKVTNYNLLTSDELEDLYYSYNTENINNSYTRLTAKRNKVMVGLIVYQGLKTSELIRLEIQDILLDKGKIYIKESRLYNARTLILKP